MKTASRKRIDNKKEETGEMKQRNNVQLSGHSQEGRGNTKEAQRDIMISERGGKDTEGGKDIMGQKGGTRTARNTSHILSSTPSHDLPHQLPTSPPRILWSTLKGRRPPLTGRWQVRGAVLIIPRWRGHHTMLRLVHGGRTGVALRVMAIARWRRPMGIVATRRSTTRGTGLLLGWVPTTRRSARRRRAESNLRVARGRLLLLLLRCTGWDVQGGWRRNLLSGRMGRTTGTSSALSRCRRGCLASSA
ncbi:hypothetical protein JAAARDRAFT_461857 [Jaapia argillacea MUCL 33604]|uniref:Uncharacterized protein n=1 Tax=Jaapia argillacea MUCL 33604 TaxID=933084 RepID=A0A067QIR9_9AGAM|nr:hypothetical protein JAAARDRAFT_461857 [Jaapia argillacea MUCL 33604]